MLKIKKRKWVRKDYTLEYPMKKRRNGNRSLRSVLSKLLFLGADEFSDKITRTANPYRANKSGTIYDRLEGWEIIFFAEKAFKKKIKECHPDRNNGGAKEAVATIQAMADIRRQVYFQTGYRE